jgi:hypothetical protein
VKPVKSLGKKEGGAVWELNSSISIFFDLDCGLFAMGLGMGFFPLAISMSE